MRFAGLIIIAQLSACASFELETDTRREPPPPRAEQERDDSPVLPSWERQEPAAPTQSGTSSSSKPAVVALLAEADRQHQQGERERAAATLERALRIEPRNPLLWHRLAKLKLTQGQYGKAANFAAKSNSFAAQDRGLQAANWRIIATAKEQSGDASGARAARNALEKLTR